MLANLGEIMNIATRLLLTDTSPRLKLDKVYAAKAVPADAAAIVANARGRIDFQVSFPKYGSGTLAALSM